MFESAQAFGGYHSPIEPSASGRGSMFGLSEAEPNFERLLGRTCPSTRHQGGLLSLGGTGEAHGSAASADQVVLPLPRVFSEIRKDAKMAVVAHGHLPPLMEALYVEDQIDKALGEWLKDENQPPLLILTGSAGHGKSAAITRATKLAEEHDIELNVRPDATHADRPDETYKEGLRRFLAPFADGAGNGAPKHLLAMNLGLALNFFTTNNQDLARWQGIAAGFDHQFQLGMKVEGDSSPHAAILDLSHRLHLGEDEKAGVTIPFVNRLLERFDTTDEGTPAGAAVKRECSACPVAERCPVLLNARFLSLPTVRANLVHAITSAAIKEEIHLTPRLLLDTFSQLVIGPDVKDYIDEESAACSLKEHSNQVFPTDTDGNVAWGQQLDKTLFALAFPKRAAARGSSNHALIDAMRSEDPSAVRSAAMDSAMLDWMARPDALKAALPAELLSFAGLSSVRLLGREALSRLVTAYQWTSINPSDRPELGRFHQFVRACLGSSDKREELSNQLATAMRRLAVGAFFDGHDWQIPAQISVPIKGVPTSTRLLAELGSIEGEVEPMQGGNTVTRPGFNLRIQVPVAQSSDISIPIDWKSFNFLLDVANGYTPRPSDRFHREFTNRINHRLALSSAMGVRLIAHNPKVDGAVLLKAQKAGPNRFRMQARVE